ncbi:MAG: phage shock protein PspA [Proteobacteria bacterium]|nr:phage shock protein PspA [Pseudomonadota bacterium]
MGIFSRFRDIINSNISAMLDKAEDPEKLIKLMIREMEDTLVEIKASCAGVMANSKKAQRQMEEVRSRGKYWEERATLAVTKSRDDLAREALVEKRRYADRAEALLQESIKLDALVEQYQDDIRQLEEKLESAREKQRILVQRHIRANGKKRAQEEIRRFDSSEAIIKFENFENRIERMEAEADLVNFGRKPSQEAEWEGLLVDEEIEKELESLKSSLAKEDESASNG